MRPALALLLALLLASVATAAPDPSPTPRTLKVTAPAPNAQVPQSFRVQGLAPPGARLTVRVTSGVETVPGRPIGGRTFQVEGSAGEDGRFDVPMEIGAISSGATLRMTVTAVAPDGWSPPAVSFLLTRR